MPELVTDSGSKEANEKHPKKGGKLGKYKWWIIGGLAVIAILVFYFTRSSSSNSNAAGASGSTANTGVDPSTGLPYASEYGYGGLGGLDLSGLTGPAGPAGPAGPQGPKGPQGKQGNPGPGPKKPKPKKPKKKPVSKKPGPVHKAKVTSGGTHPALQLAASHAANQHRAVTPSPRRAA